MLHVLLNPSSGSLESPAFYANLLSPLLANLDLHPGRDYHLWTTESEGDGARVGREVARLTKERIGETKAVVLVMGGDGSSYELINGFFATSAGCAQAKQPHTTLPAVELELELVPVPLGTANALFSHVHHPSSSHSTSTPSPSSPSSDAAALSEGERRWIESIPPETSDVNLARLASVKAWYLGLSAPSDRLATGKLRLPLTRTTFHPPHPGDSATSTPPAPTLSHIVLSLSLHAALLAKSELLRAQYPGIERFKRAAESVLHVRFSGVLSFPSTVQRWDPRARAFAAVGAVADGHDVGAGKGGGERVELQGPFAYLLSTATVRRLEPEFCIAPLLPLLVGQSIAPSPSSSSIAEDAPHGQTMDVLVLRPERSRSVKAGGRDAWVAKVKEVLGGAYQDGKHIDPLLLDPVSEDGSDDGGPAMLEYYRTPSFTFTPPSTSSFPIRTPTAVPTDDKDEDEDKLSRLVCADGAVSTCPVGGHVEVCVLDPSSPSSAAGGVWVWA